MNNVCLNKKGQVTIFIIIAILVVAAVVLFFSLRKTTNIEKLPSEFQDVYGDFVGCLEDELNIGTQVLASQGGYINLPDFVSGSEYMPFSSQLDFVGVDVPYWYYVSGNNIQEEQVPSVNSMENDLESFIEQNVYNCLPDNFVSGISVSSGTPSAKIGIKNKEIQLNLGMDLTFDNGDSVVEVFSHDISINSDLGRLYSSAKDVYDEEQKSLFLENYTIGVLNYYAPVDGVEFSCSSKVWSVPQVYSDVQEAVRENLAVVKAHGSADDYFVLRSLENKIPDDVYVDFLTSENWPTTFGVNPSEGALLIADPVGDEQGFGSLGFCYVTYHFVYDYKYPVLVQLRSESTGEMFQFPMAVVVQGTNPRESLVGENSIEEKPNICENANTEFNIETVDSSSRRVDSDISYECFSQTCRIGSSENGVLEGMFPQCVNGYVIAKTDGFKDAGVQLSTVNPGSLTIFMDRLYEMDVSLLQDNSLYSGEAVVTFEGSEGNVDSLLYPSQDSIKLSQGTYTVSVSVYENTSLDLGSSTQEYCTQVPRKITGVFGLTKEECYDVEVPEQLVSKALSGGGTADYSFSESDLSENQEILINFGSFPEPDSLVQIQQNSILFENKDLEIGLE